ncbi:4-hydroxy-3-methylbut-2-enyl diphosphate reductase [Desulfohalovibrio reitneri]|uniref:4-hydroxy-3-methylbut-2-enyl diphosphate reductase n=1 Tax=Desulfohalovibrio reitneri TaxID=1307759 RepID=UPI0004A73AC1|nr:4-hydroxy-3-methylbut-2-enyl diphosphate reductase [Desulfohalovibrio reitneri]
MKVKRADTAGFCMGVDLALRKLDKLSEVQPGSLLTLGPIIHNPQVLQEYEAKGVGRADALDDVPHGSTVVIRAHGVPRNVETRLEEMGCHIEDATCPKVKKAQVLIHRMARHGRTVLLYGEEDHPEVRGLVSYAGPDPLVFDDPEILRDYPFERDKGYCLAAQTTQDREAFEQMAAELEAREDVDIAVLRTICDATRNRQREALTIAKEVDCMVVVGGRQSGNTRRLAQVVSQADIPCFLVETAEELEPEKLLQCNVVGLTAGASTPKKLIDEVQAVLEDFSGEG